jgi:PPIC-type PPIASE domain/SurA-like N-terminal domain
MGGDTGTGMMPAPVMCRASLSAIACDAPVGEDRVRTLTRLLKYREGRLFETQRRDPYSSVATTSATSVRSSGPVPPPPLRRFGLPLFGALLLALLAGFAMAQGIGAPRVPAGDVALVEGMPAGAGRISRVQFRAAFEQAVAQGGAKSAPAPGSEAAEEATKTAMQRLLKAAWVRGQAAEDGVAVDSAQVSAAIVQFKQQQRYETPAQLRRFLSASQLSPAEFRALARLQLLSAAVQQDVTEAVPAPGDSAVEDYYEAAKVIQFTTAPSYDVRLILNADRAKVAAAKAALEHDDSPASWQRLAERYSEDPGAEHLGGLHKAIPAEPGEPLGAAIAAAPEHTLQGILEAGKAFFVFEVEGSTPAEVESLERVRSHIVAQLTRQDREEALESFAYEFETKWTSRSHCAAGFEVEGCDGYRGSGHPPNAPSACYEAHPKAGIAASSCPAPVAQLAPAAPGTVSILAPGGIALPQRPRPEVQSSEDQRR